MNLITGDELIRDAALIAAVGAIIYALRLMWLYFVRPLYRSLLALGEFMEAQPTLLEIAHEFKPNDGETLRDQVDLMNGRLSNIESSLERIVTNGSWNGDERRT